MWFNDILVEAGGFGLYQKILTYVYLALALFLSSFSGWTQIFILLIPPYRCKNFDNDTQWIQSFAESDEQTADLCSIKNGDNFTACANGFVYDFSETFPTYTSENDLVCEDGWKMYFAHTFYWMGSIFGTLIFGVFNDKYGRKKAYQVTTAVTLAADVMTYFSSHHIMFLIARFISAAGGRSISTVTYILVIEHSIPSKRRVIIAVWTFAFALASLSIVWLAYLVFHWKYLLMIAWIPPATGLILSYFLAESPSWLISKGKIEEAVANIERMARINGVTIKKEFIMNRIQVSIEKEEKLNEKVKTVSQSIEKTNSVTNTKNEKEISSFQTLKKVLRSPNLRKRILLLGFLWMSASFCYNGNNLELHYLPFNMYVSYSIGALMEIPGCFFMMATLDRFGRRWVNCGTFIAGGIFGIVSSQITAKNVMLTLVMLMRMLFGAAYDVTFSVSSEIIPTEIRGRSVSVIRTCGGLGSSVAPFVVSLAQKDPVLPLICFGLVAIIAGLMTLTLPETARQQLPQTIQEGEIFGTDQSFWLCPFIRNKAENEEENNIYPESFDKPQHEIEKNKNECVCLGIQKIPMD